MIKSREKIAFVWYFDKASQIFSNWRDGYRAAIEEINKKYDVEWFLDKKVPPLDVKYKFLLLWDDSNSSFFKEIDNYKCRKGISLTTNPTNISNLKKVDVIFVESKPIYDLLRPMGFRVILAFGTDTNFFHPKKVEKDIDYFYPATFSPWKRQNDIAYLGNKLLCVGTVQPDGEEIYNYCKQKGVKCEIGYFPAEKIRDYYRRSKKVLIPAIHGSERTVLEAMSMNIPVEVSNSWNYRARSYLKEFEETEYLSTREFILNNYSHEIFANNLLKGIEQ